MERTTSGMLTIWACALLTLSGAQALGQDDVLLIEDESDEMLIIDEEPEETLFIEEAPEEMLLIEEDSEDVLVIDEETDEPLTIEHSEDSDQELMIGDEPAGESSTIPAESSSDTGKSGIELGLDSARLEWAHIPDSDSATDDLQYLSAVAGLHWSENSNLEIRVAALFDAHAGQGDDDWSEAAFDYDEIYVRFRTERSAITLGTQRIIWGRIDEFPPTDRLSTQDLRRLALDDLADRRLASPALRFEHFLASGKLDVVIYPSFREAELADKDSPWYPVNRQQGTLLGLNTTPLVEALVRGASIDENAPDSEGGFGVRYTSIGSTADYGITLQKGRSTLPYFAYNPANNMIEGRFPRSTSLAGDIGFEALGGTLKLEAAWVSDTPVTRSDGRYHQVESVGWGVALELFPGDSDARLNLQLTGQALLGAPDVLDRDNIYAFNGTYDIPFADQTWRATTRFNIGLDENDIYLNPEIAYTGWDAHEAYLEIHYFDGDKGTIGGFHEHHSHIAVGWRGSF